MLADFGDAMHTYSVEDEPTADAKAFYALLAASKEPTSGRGRSERGRILGQDASRPGQGVCRARGEVRLSRVSERSIVAS
jgi:hypothetical protein